MTDDALPPSLLRPAAEPLGLGVGVSVGLHALLIVALVVPTLFSVRRPLFDPDDAITVNLVSLPKADRLPTRATRQAAPQAPPTPPDTKAPEPPPPRQSDLAVQTPDAKAAKAAAPPDPQRKTSPDVNTKMDDLLSSLDADEGPRDRDATALDGEEGATASQTIGSGISDPEAARYVRQISQIFNDAFRPLPALRGQGLKAVLLVKIDPSGRVTDRQIVTPSGNASWDRAAESATFAVSDLPLPPERYRDGSTSFRVVFAD